MLTDDGLLKFGSKGLLVLAQRHLSVTAFMEDKDGERSTNLR